MDGRNAYIAEFDEIETLSSALYQGYETGKISKKKVIDTIETFLEYAYQLGEQIAQEDLEIDEGDIAYFEVSEKEMLKAIYKKIDGKTFKERAEEHLDEKQGNGIFKNFISSEFHRNTNEGMHGLVQKYGPKKVTKTWQTMRDDRVRDTHDYLEGMTIPYSEDFYTYNGDHAPLPGMFGIAEEDCGCRCIAKLNKI